MANIEKYDDLIIGSGVAGRLTAWTHDSRRRTVIVERELLGGACTNVACLPSKNISGGNRTTRNRLIPFCMFTDPELARVGKNEVEARREGNRIPDGEVADGRSAPHKNDLRAARLHEGAGRQR